MSTFILTSAYLFLELKMHGRIGFNLFYFRFSKVEF